MGKGFKDVAGKTQNNKNKKTTLLWAHSNLLLWSTPWWVRLLSLYSARIHDLGLTAG